MSSDHSSGLLLGFQLEQAFALVGRTSLDPLALADEVLTILCGERLRKVEQGDTHWINEGARHSLRLGMRHGTTSLGEGREILLSGHQSLREHAAQVEGRLLPTGMHPWLEPERAQRWPHGGDLRDQAFVALGGSARQGWANQQGLRLSLPFADEKAFREQFACLRFLSPLLPALAASSPFVVGQKGPAMNCRLASRRDFLGGPGLVPPAYYGRAAYEAELVVPWRERIRSLGLTLSPLDLCGHALYADFDAGLIVVDLLDTQECLDADLALCAFVAAATGWLVHESPAAKDPWPSPRIADLLEVSILQAEEGVIRDMDFLEIMKFPEHGPCRFSELLQYLVEDTLRDDPAIASCQDALGSLRRASLATRMLVRLQDLGDSWGPEELYNVYREVLGCSEENRMFKS